jgi:hypothetical protein
MGRVAKAIKSTTPVTPARKPVRSPTVAADKPTMAADSAASKRSAAIVAPIAKRKPGRPAKATVEPPPKAKRAPKAAARAPVALPAPKVSKDELRAQVEKLQQLVTTLRAKSRESNKSAKAATARIAELETQVVQSEKRSAAAPASLQQPKPARAKRRSREIDPGDAVPPGVAVQESAPLDEEAETALENLEEHLGHG